jgi:hypothetical protein
MTAASDTFHRLFVRAGCTSSPLNAVGHAWMHDRFCAAHQVVDMTQGRALCGGQAGKVGIKWVHGGLVSWAQAWSV